MSASPTPPAPKPPASTGMKHYARSRAWCEWPEFGAWQGLALADLARSSRLADSGGLGDLAGLADGPGAALSPFHLLSLPGITAAQQRECSTQWMAGRLQASATERAALALEFAAQAAAQAAALLDDAAAPRKIRLGYLSCDFHQHATALLLVEMLEAHDRQRFELHAYSYGPDDGLGMRQRLERCFDHFTDITALDNLAAARAIHADGIDILIDLKGYTAGTRTAVLTYRPAPVQVNYLGYPGTLGGNFCDYLVSDDFITPASAAADYSEALARLPHSYQPHGGPSALPEPPLRASVGLPEEGLVLCCFNQAYKFTPELFDIWCMVLAYTPGSVLWLLGNPQAEGNLRREALQRGIAPHRLIFAPDLPQGPHLARLQLADLVLDTSPYNAHTTASDALWAGVPLITCAGDTFASRVAGSLLHAAGLPELVTHSLSDYADLALALADDPARLRALRAQLARARATAPLFDVPAYTLALESLYQQMWDQHRAGLPPQALGTA